MTKKEKTTKDESKESSEGWKEVEKTLDSLIKGDTVDINQKTDEFEKSINDEIKEEWKKLEKIDEERLKLLKDPNLLYNTIIEIQNEGVVGEEETILILINKSMLRLVKNSKPTSSNQLISDEPGGGKDNVAIHTFNVLMPTDKLYHRTGLSKKALDYWGTNKPDDWTWDGCLLYLEDPEEDLLKSQSLKILASGRNIISTVKDQKLLDMTIKGKPVILVTSFLAILNTEGGRRWDLIRCDKSTPVTVKVLAEALKKEAGKKEIKPNNELRYAIQNHLKKVEVVIPYIEVLQPFLTPNLVMRTQVYKLSDFIKGSAAFHQYQRDKDDKGRVIANLFDYEYGAFIFEKLQCSIANPLSIDEQEFMDVLYDSKIPLSIAEIGMLMNRHGKDWVYRHNDSFKSKGLIKEVAVFDQKANKDITKYYPNYNYQLYIELPDSDIVRNLVLAGFSSSFAVPSNNIYNNNVRYNKTKKEVGFCGFCGFYNILERINKNRQKCGFPCLSLRISQKPPKPQNLYVGVVKRHAKTKIKPNPVNEYIDEEVKK